MATGFLTPQWSGRWLAFARRGRSSRSLSAYAMELTRLDRGEGVEDSRHERLEVHHAVGWRADVPRQYASCRSVHFAQGVLAAVDTYEVVEAYLDDKYLPSYLILGRRGSEAFHALFAVDVAGDSVRVVTFYRPDGGFLHCIDVRNANGRD